MAERRCSVCMSEMSECGVMTDDGPAWDCLLCIARSRITTLEAERDGKTQALLDFKEEAEEIAEWSHVVKCQLEEAKTKLASQQAIIDKLPKTADGVRTVPGMRVWAKKSDIELEIFTDARHFICVDPTTDSWEISSNEWAVQSCYSTPSAAKAAQEKQTDEG